MASIASLFTPEEDHEPDEPARDRCTPEKLEAFIRRLGRMPTLTECKREYGGILGAMVDGWELQRRGRIKNGRLTE